MRRKTVLTLLCTVGICKRNKAHLIGMSDQSFLTKNVHHWKKKRERKIASILARLTRFRDENEIGTAKTAWCVQVYQTGFLCVFWMYSENSQAH